MERILLLMIILLLCYLGQFQNKQIQKYKSYDYHIDINQDSITVYTQEGKVETVHADSLHSFIIRDNL